MANNNLNLDALRIEGSLLPAEFIQKLLELKADHQSASDYGIPLGLNLKDEIGRCWRIASALWADFKMRRDKPGAKPEDVALKNWLIPLFTRVLGFENWTATSGEEIDERRFPLTHKLGSTPLLLLPHTIDLDKSDTRFAPEGRRRSPHATVQELLNASDAALWGIVANGDTLRILRDNPSLTRPAYIEADLSRIFEEERYADFVALWLLAHGTRFGNSTESHLLQPPILEHWHGQAQETGERALEKLRVGVTETLRQLGNGFISHPGNTALREALKNETLKTDDFFKQLLRLVYRLILLHTAEDRGLLHAPNATPEQRELYAKGYSANLLRERALKSRADRHADLWQGLQVSLRGLANGADPLGLPALGGLFAADKCPDLDAAELPNKSLLAAVRALCFFRSGAVLARINYRDMDTEELGSVYESLLELQPAINVDANPWRFGFVGDDAEGETRGSARKLTGSYYTPDELVQELIKSALEPKIAEALKAADPRAALLALKVIDPASGSGHFLLAAARRIAAEVARLDAESDIPEAQAFRHALREVVAHCIYGVDLNPLAVELCQTALWLETLEPGKPLGFLDHHVRHGNSLVGILDPAIMADGIPAKAYTALSGDDGKTCTFLKSSNRAQLGGRQMGFFNTGAAKELAASHAALEAMPEDTVDAIAAKRAAFVQAETDQQLAHERLRCDLFCAAFFAPKTAVNATKVPLSGDLVRAAEGQPMRPGVAELSRELAEEYHFFHWRLAFPEVFAQGGFDVVLANPPWEVSQFSEIEFFFSRIPELATMNSAERGRAIKQLEARRDPVWNVYLKAMFGYEATNSFVRECGRFSLSAVGKLNLYPLFTELATSLISSDGFVGLIVPSGLATDDSTKHLFNFLLQSNRLGQFFEFENEGFFGVGQGHMVRFALVTIRGASETQITDFLFQGKSLRELHDPRRHFRLTASQVALLNPNTGNCPIFQTDSDVQMNLRLYQQGKCFVREVAESPLGNPWNVTFRQGLFNTASDSKLFYTAPKLREMGAEQSGSFWVSGRTRLVPLYEAKMAFLYNHRHGDFTVVSDSERTHKLPAVSEQTLSNPNYSVSPFYWVEESEVETRLLDRSWPHNWLFGWRDVTDARASARTLIASVIPRYGVADTYLLMFPSTPINKIAALIGNMTSLVLDYAARQKVGGLHLKYNVMKQLPVLPPDRYTPADLDFIVPRVLELTYTAHDLTPFARDLGYDGPPFAWNPDRRALLRAELDACYAKLYGLTRDELRYILDPADIYGDDYPSETFRVLQKNEIRQFGEYRTRRLVLEAWDRLFLH
jgi:hypothetical protein